MEKQIKLTKHQKNIIRALQLDLHLVLSEEFVTPAYVWLNTDPKLFEQSSTITALRTKGFIKIQFNAGTKHPVLLTEAGEALDVKQEQRKCD